LRSAVVRLNEDGLFNVEYADVLGIPFDFNAKAGRRDAQPAARETVRFRPAAPTATRSRSASRVERYRVELPNDRLRPTSTSDARARADARTSASARRRTAQSGESSSEQSRPRTYVHTGGRCSAVAGTLTLADGASRAEAKLGASEDPQAQSCSSHLKRITPASGSTAILLLQGEDQYPAQLKYKMLAGT
jgi:type III restriction enzyme